MTSAETLFPNKVTLTGAQGWDFTVSFVGDTIQLTTMTTAGVTMQKALKSTIAILPSRSFHYMKDATQTQHNLSPIICIKYGESSFQSLKRYPKSSFQSPHFPYEGTCSRGLQQPVFCYDIEHFNL